MPAPQERPRGPSSPHGVRALPSPSARKENSHPSGRARQVHLPLSWGSPGKRGLLPGPTREGGRVVETAAKQQTAWARGPQAQAQASPRLRGKHRHQPRDRAEERPRRGLARRAPAGPELQTGPAVPAGRRQPCTGPRPTPPHQGLQERSGGTLTPTLYLAPDLGHDRLTESF